MAMGYFIVLGIPELSPEVVQMHPWNANFTKNQLPDLMWSHEIICLKLVNAELLIYFLVTISQLPLSIYWRDRRTMLFKTLLQNNFLAQFKQYPDPKRLSLKTDTVNVDHI